MNPWKEPAAHPREARAAPANRQQQYRGKKKQHARRKRREHGHEQYTLTGSAAAARDPAATAAARRGTESAAMCGDGEWERAGLRVRVLGFDRRREEGTGAGGQEGGFCLSGARNGNGGERREEGGRWRRCGEAFSVWSLLVFVV